MTRRARAGLYTPCLVEGDAVGNDVLGMADVLACHGWDVRVFADTSSDSTAAVRRPWEILSFLDDADDMFIYHHSASSPEGVDLLRRLRCRRVVKYHNVTPPAFFSGFSSLYERSCRDGREQLETLCRLGLDMYLADSVFDMNELLPMLSAASRHAVIPPFHRIERLLSGSAGVCALSDSIPLILCVGRIVPNKNHRMLIESIGFLCGEYGTSVRLAIVGGIDPAFGDYVAGLRERVAQLGLNGCVEFLGKVKEDELKACYRKARVFAITSLHEGFCVPVVEAMAAGVPVVAYAGGAVAETVGDAGLVWDNTDPEVFGASIRRILQDASLRNALVTRGKERFARHYETEIIAGQFLEAMKSVGTGAEKSSDESSDLQSKY